MSTAMKQMTEVAEKLVAYGRKGGAAEIEVGIRTSNDFSVQVFNGELEKLTEAGSKNLAIRVFVEGKQATAASSDFSPETLHRLVDNAITRARLGGSDPFAGLPEAEKLSNGEGQLKLYDPLVLTLAPEKKIAIARELEAIGLKDKRIRKSTGASFDSGESLIVLVNSKGFSGAYRRTGVSCGVGFEAGSGDNLQQDYWFDGGISLAGLMPVEAIAKKAVERTARMIGARKVETQNVTLVTDPQMSGRLLGFLSQCIAGASVARRQTFLAEKVGQRIGNEQVNIVDDGLIPSGRRSRPFDSEGVPCRRSTFVDKGILQGFVLNTYFARKLKMSSTGHAGGLTNFYWEPGTSTPESIVKSVDKGLLLTGVMGQGTVPTTGDISLGASGLWIEKGEIVFPVAEITISGNLADLLMNVEMVGNDVDLAHGINAPTIKFKQISVGGTAKA